MQKVVIACLLLMLMGASIWFFAPRFIGLGLLLLAVPGVVLVQATLVQIAGRFTNNAVAVETNPPPRHKAEFEALLWAYRDLKLFLARAVGYIGLLFGVITVNWYYIALSATLIILFWTLDQMHVTPSESAHYSNTNEVSGSH